jgi:hypothetical protein
MIEPPFDNKIEFLCCRADSSNKERFYISGWCIKRNLDNVGRKKVQVMGDQGIKRYRAAV